MSKEFLKRAGGGEDSGDSLLPPLPPERQRSRGTFYLPKDEYSQVRVLLAQIGRDTGIQLKFATFLRLALKAAQPRLETLAKQRRILTTAEVYRAILGPADQPEG